MLVSMSIRKINILGIVQVSLKKYSSLPNSLSLLYFQGFGYLFDAKTRDSIMSQSLQDEKPFRLSDIYVSGILPERLNFICDILPFTFHQGLAEECIDLIKKNNRKSSQGQVPPLIVCSTGRHIAQNSYSDYYRMWTVLKYVYNDLLTSTLSTNE